MSKATKFLFIGTLVSLIMLVGSFWLLGPNPSNVSAQTTETPTDRRTVTVNGSGSITATPDQAIVALGVQTQAETASEALTSNTEQMNSLLTAIRSAGVANSDIRTLSVQLYPQFESPSTPLPDEPTQEQAISNFVAVNTIEITVRDLDNLGDLLDETISAGGNRIDFINLNVSDPNQALEQARSAAFENASEKAAQLAELAGMQLGEVVSIVENSYFPSPVMAESLRMDMAALSVPINPGSQTFTIDVNVTFLLEPDS